MGKSSKPTVGFWYHVAYHHGITIGPIDAFLEFRGGDKIAWQGELTSSGRINVMASNLWGGEKDQGGIEGPLDVMFGEPDQQPNVNLKQYFGDQTCSWRGFTTVAFLGGRYGAMNPYPQKPAYKFRQIVGHWDDPGCWYPEKAEVPAIQSVESLTVSYTKTTDNVYVQTPGVPLPALNPNPSAYATAASGNHASWSEGVGQTGIMWVNITFPPAAPGSTSIKVMVAWDDSGRLLGSQDLVVATDDPGPPIVGYPSRAGYRITAAPGKKSGWLAFACTDGLDVDTGASLGSTSKHRMLVSSVQEGKSGYINPAHVLYYSRTNSDMGRESRDNINDASLRAAADTLYAEGFGICPKWDPASESVEDLEKRICKLIGGSFTRGLEDGQWYLDLARGDYVLADLPILTDDDILDFKEQPSLLDNAVNSVSVSYFDPEKKETIVTAPVRSMAMVAAFGTIHQTAQYPEIPTDALASRIAQRDMLATATPTRAFDLVTTRATYAWRPNQYFRLQAPKRGIADMVCIVGDRETGTLKSGAIKLKCAQDIYQGVPTASWVAVEPGVDPRPSQTPIPVTLQRVQEAPYIEVVSRLSRSDLDALTADSAFVFAAAADPAESRDFTMQTAPHASTAFVAVGNGEWCPTATIIEGDTLVDAPPATSFTLAAGDRLANVAAGSAALWDDEVVRVDAIDASATPPTLTLGRSCADTVPTPHDAGSRIYFYGESLAYDPTEFTAGESIDARLLTNTGSAQLDPSLATIQTLELQGRLLLPYPPAKLRIAGSAYPSTVSGTFTVTWAHRNRVTQADQLLDSEAASVTPADNQRYRLQLLDADDAVLVERDDIGPGSASVALNYTGQVTLTLQTIDPYGGSLQMHRVTFDYTSASPAPPASTITATAYTPVDNSIVFDGGGEPL